MGFRNKEREVEEKSRRIGERREKGVRRFEEIEESILAHEYSAEKLIQSF